MHLNAHLLLLDKPQHGHGLDSPVSRDGFAFANGDLYAEASGHNRHRRATLAELKTHFQSGSDKDHPAHWFEAQLIHYGLPPSKTRAVARMRLFDAVNKAGALKVPAHVSKLKGELKKEWTKLDREAKKALKGGSGAAATTAAAAGTAGKRRERRERRRRVSEWSQEGEDHRYHPESFHPLEACQGEDGTIQTQDCHAKAEAGSETQVYPDTQARPSTTGSHEVTARKAAYQPFRLRTIRLRQQQPSASGTSSFINGRYAISSPYVSGEWPHYGEDFELVLTLAGSKLWGDFELGVYQGVFLLDQRPWQSSHDELSFIWRGREDEGPILYGNSNRGWIKFLGGGRIEGYLDIQRIEFYGERLLGQSTTSEISPREMGRKFEGYSQAEYDRENRARWH
ncbi:hypothetical protein PG994_002008 [Apiospora phragmitis]|uniref:Uncharacterized protein n=1 Tax=Apiospora phragmitis TaxID=2905665 RepID=A0ABR1WV68_9PEZI